MPTTAEQLAALKKTIEQLITVSANRDPETVMMTPAQFFAYVGDQIVKAGAEGEPEKNARLQHLLGNIGLVEKDNAFDKDGASFPVYGGPDSRQAQTAAREESSKEMSHGAAKAPDTSDRNFAQKARDLFKGREDLLGEFDALLAKLEKGNEEAPAEVAKAEEKPEPKDDAGKVEKDEKKPFAWPRDLNEKEIPADLQFGADASQKD